LDRATIFTGSGFGKPQKPGVRRGRPTVLGESTVLAPRRLPD
jgi:hypothetical protein